MTKILILGKSGQVSTYLQRILQSGYDIHVAGRESLDLTNPDSVYQKIEEISPAVIINAAAYTAVDAAESDKEAAFAINRDSVREIAKYSNDHQVPLIH